MRYDERKDEFVRDTADESAIPASAATYLIKYEEKEVKAAWGKNKN
jgi:hypothetical protein